MHPMLLQIGRTAHCLFLVLLFGGFCFALPLKASEQPPLINLASEGNLSSLSFIQNVGQWHEGALFQSHWQGATLFLAQDALWLSYLDAPTREYESFDPETGATTPPPPRGGVHLRLSFIGANPHPTIETFASLSTSVNFFRGNDLNRWYTKVPVWGGIRYRDLYPGVDLELTGVAGTTQPRFIIHSTSPTRPSDIQLQIEGAESFHTNGSSIVAHTQKGDYFIPLFQLKNLTSEAVPEVLGTTIRAPFQRSITPEPLMGSSNGLPSNLLYSTFLGGTDYDYGTRITQDQSGAIYIGGTTESFDFPTTPGTFDPTPEPSEYRVQAFIAKLNPTGTALEYSTFIDGSNSDYIYGIAVDGSGTVYASGETWSNDFPTTPNTPQPNNQPEVDGYALKLSPSGSALLYSTYLGGNNIDYARDMALGADGSVVVIGTTVSPDFPLTPNAYDTTINDVDMFVTRLSPDGSVFLYSTALGGDVRERSFSVAIDDMNSAYVLGSTESSNYPSTPDAFDPTPDPGSLVVTKFTPNGNALLYSTGIGGFAGFWAGAITIDATGAAYLTAEAEQPGFPVTEGAYDTECGIPSEPCSSNQRGDGVLIKLNPAGSDVVYGTYFGGAIEDWGHEVAVDSAGNAYVMGRLNSPDLLSTLGAYRGPSPYNIDFAIFKFNPTGTELLHITRTPGAAGQSFYLEAEDVIWYTGGVEDQYIPYETTPGAYDTTYNGNFDVGVGRLVLPKAATVAIIEPTGGLAFSTVDTFTATTTFATATFTSTAVFTHAPRHALSMPPIAPSVNIIGDPFVHYDTIDNTVVAPLHPYTLTLQTDPSLTAPLRLYTWDGSAWQPDPTATYDAATRTITATRTAFGWFFLAQTEPVPAPTPCPTTTLTPSPTVIPTLSPTSIPSPTATSASALHKLFLPLICK